jgi:hypothetical protein
VASRDENAGMTVNERLFAAGLLDAFDQAVLRRDREALVDILNRVDVPGPDLTIDAIFADPARYGYPPHLSTD